MKIIRFKVNRLATLVISMFTFIYVNAGNVNIDGLKYYLFPETHEVVIDNGNTWSGVLEIPSEVSYKGESINVSGMAWLAFGNCTGLTKVHIPKTIINVIHHVLSDDPDVSGAVSADFMNPFEGCTSLESIEVDENNPAMQSIGDVLFSKDGTKLYAFPAGKKTDSYVVPEGVTWIGGGAFNSNSYLGSLEFPESVSGICGYAFNDCALDTLVIRGIIDDSCIDGYLFLGLSESAKLYVQTSEMDRYMGIFPGKILPLEEYHTGILAPTSLHNQTHPIYDLNGVRIDQPKKGIYIQNGKKRIVR